MLVGFHNNNIYSKEFIESMQVILYSLLSSAEHEQEIFDLMGLKMSNVYWAFKKLAVKDDELYEKMLYFMTKFMNHS